MTIALLVIGGVFVYAVLAGAAYRIIHSRNPNVGPASTHWQVEQAMIWPIMLLIFVPAFAAAGKLLPKGRDE